MSNQENKAVSLLRAQYQNAHEVLEGTLQDVTSEQAHWSPPGTANPLGATYAHIVISEDGVINGMLKGSGPLSVSTWAGKIGVSELPPMPGPEVGGLPSWSEWARRVKVDQAALRSYAQAVYAATDEYLASLTDDDLNRSLDLSGLGVGQQTLGWLLTLMLSNVNWHTGEIACLKGLQGARGYPF
jgi:hypothetical protein